MAGGRMTDVLGKVTDVQQTLSYGSSKMGRTFLRLGLTAFVACGVLVWLQPDDFSIFEWAMTYSGLVVGAACALYGLDRWLRPKPLLVLSSKGLQKCLDTLKTFLIPWHEVKGVETADITGTYRGRTVTVTGVTVVLVTRAFYDQHIHVDVPAARARLGIPFHPEGRDGAGRAASRQLWGDGDRAARGGHVSLAGVPRQEAGAGDRPAHLRRLSAEIEIPPRSSPRKRGPITTTIRYGFPHSRERRPKESNPPL
jgi:hypothetical protein